MPCKYKRIRTVDVGRKGHHYIKVGIKSKKGKREGTTEAIGGLRTYKKSKKQHHSFEELEM